MSKNEKCIAKLQAEIAAIRRQINDMQKAINGLHLDVQVLRGRSPISHQFRNDVMRQSFTETLVDTNDTNQCLVKKKKKAKTRR